MVEPPTGVWYIKHDMKKAPVPKTYIAIDLKSFYASVECADRGLDPLGTNLVVADASRTEKTICLAVTPSLKAYGIPGRARLFEVVQKADEINRRRRGRAPGRQFSGKSFLDEELKKDPSLELDYIIAPPRMARYMEVSNQIFDIYLKFVAPEDIHSYSIDESFIDVTAYLGTYHMTAREMAMTMIKAVLRETGITATAGIGTNLFLCKVAMDVVAKHVPADENGVRMAQLDEMTYRRLMWDHTPLTDFWRVGKGYAEKLNAVGLHTMGDIARCSLGKPGEFYNEELLYKMFGVNAELLIDHAWGWEPCTIADIKAYVPETHSLSVGQVLTRPYTFEEGRLIIREMADNLTLDLFDKGLVTDQIVLTVGYDVENITDPEKKKNFHGATTKDPYGRTLPKSAHGSRNIGRFTASSDKIIEAAVSLYEQIVDPALTIRRAYVVANHAAPREKAASPYDGEQMDLFTLMDGDKLREKEEESAREEKVLKAQKALLDIKHKYGKNAVLKGFNFLEGATTKQRNNMIGGHQAENDDKV